MKLKTTFLSLFLFLVSSVILSQEYSIYKKIESLTSQVSTEHLKASIEKLVSFHNRNAFSDTSSDIKGIGAARRWLYSEFNKINEETGSRMKVYYDNFYPDLPKRYTKIVGENPIRMVNVIAVIPGTSSDRTLIINGHYDSRTYSGMDTQSYAPGANDDGSGTIALLEIARILAKEKFRNTIILAAFTAEEIGLYGSSHMAEEAKNKNMNIEGVIANDMIGNIEGGDGTIDNTFLRCFSPGPSNSSSRNLALYFKRISEKYYPFLDLKMIFRLDRFGRGGDHSPFIRRGFAGVRFTEPYENYEIQHSPYDTPDRMSFEYFTRTTQLNIALAAYWAESPSPPMLISVSRDSLYRTIIQFICDEKEENLKGFSIYNRQTDNGYWEESKFFPLPEKVENRFFGKVYQVIIENKDIDYYEFGVASVNKKGYQSIATTFDYQEVRGKIRQIYKNRK